MATDNNPQIIYDVPEDYKTLIYLQTNIGGYFFDAFLKISHHGELTLTSHPVQTGANMTDHAYVQPATLTMTIGMSDVMTSIINGQFQSQDSRSVEAAKIFRDIQEKRRPVQIFTRLKLYQNMLLKTIDFNEDYKTLHGLLGTVVFQEIFVVEVSKTKRTTRIQTTNSTKKGKTQVEDPGSAAYQIEKAIGQ
jgi:hypothetical protein